MSHSPSTPRSAAFWTLRFLEKAQELGRRLDGHRQPNRQSWALDHARYRQRRCALPLAFRTRGTPFTDARARLLMHRHSLPLQLPDDTTVVPRAMAHAARRVVARALRAARQPVSTTREHHRVHAQACQLEQPHRSTANAAPPVWSSCSLTFHQTTFVAAHSRSVVRLLQARRTSSRRRSSGGATGWTSTLRAASFLTLNLTLTPRVPRPHSVATAERPRMRL